MIDEILVKKAVKGDPTAFIKLCQRYQGLMYKTAYGILGNEHDAADAIQETLLKSYRDIHKLRDPQQFKNWLCRILVNRCIDVVRQRQRTTPVEQIWLPDTVEHNSDIKMDISQAVAELDEQYRVVIVLRFFQDMTINDIAKVLNCPTGTVKSRIYRALQKMKAKLNLDNQVGGDILDLC
ncbi:sigma-70 family RNA polymerase sigma factor [Peptococcaceae bacterium 1198_IL3148]